MLWSTPQALKQDIPPVIYILYTGGKTPTLLGDMYHAARQILHDTVTYYWGLKKKQ